MINKIKYNILSFYYMLYDVVVIRVRYEINSSRIISSAKSEIFNKLFDILINFKINYNYNHISILNPVIA